MAYPVYNVTLVSQKPTTRNGYEALESVPGKDVYLTISQWQRPRIQVTFRNVIRVNEGTATVKKESTNEIVESYDVNERTDIGSTNSWTSPIFTNLEPDTWYTVTIPQGFVIYTYYNEILGVNPQHTFRFKTVPLAKVVTWEMDSYPFTNDTQKLKVNRTSNIKLNFGREYTSTFGTYLQTYATAPSYIGIGTTLPTTAKVHLYKKTNDELVETIDFSKTFAVDRVGDRSDYTPGNLILNFTTAFDCGTEYYLLFETLLTDILWDQTVGTVTDKTLYPFKIDQINFCNSGHDYDLDRGYFYIGFDRKVVPGLGVLRIIDETADSVINELAANDYSVTYYTGADGKGIKYNNVSLNREPK